MERARWASQVILRIIKGWSSQHSGGPLHQIVGESALGSNYSKFLSNLLWVTVAAVDFVHVGDKLDALTDYKEDDDHDKDPRHTALLDSQCLLTFSVLLAAV